MAWIMDSGYLEAALAVDCRGPLKCGVSSYSDLDKEKDLERRSERLRKNPTFPTLNQN
jgi:hypothetical protein